MSELPRAELSAVAEEIFTVLNSGRQVAPFSERVKDFDLAAAYRVAADVHARRMARGERPVGRKIGFTNRTIWAEYDVWAPIWGYMYDSTVADLAQAAGEIALARLAEPRIEPEVVFGIGRAPAAGMSAEQLIDCIDWVAHGFEIVQSIYPGWRFSAADTVAAYGLHGALRIGPRQRIAGREKYWLDALASFEIDLCCDNKPIDHGRAVNVLEGPLFALRHLIEVLAADSAQPQLAAGEIVTTGTLTRAFPVAAGQTWTTSLQGIELPGLRLHMR